MTDSSTLHAAPVYGTFGTAAHTHTKRRTRACTTQRASLYSRLFFLWFESTVDITKSRRLVAADVWDLNADDRSGSAYDALMRLTPSLRFLNRYLWRLHWRGILGSAVLAMLGAIGGLMNPLLIYVLIEKAMNKETTVTYIIAMLLLRHCIKLLSELATQHSRYIQSIVATRIVGALQTLLFDTTISSTWSRDVTVSEASNMFLELNWIHQMLSEMHTIWLSPLSLASNLYMLYYFVGDAVLGSIIATAALQLLAFSFRGINKGYAKQLLKHQGRRLQIMSECFKTIQIIKLHAWENRFIEKIQHERKKESRVWWTMMYTDNLWRAILVVMPELILLVTFFGLLKMPGDTQQFDPAVAFASLAILYRTKEHVGNVSWMMFTMSSATVALKEVQKFLLHSTRRDKQTQDQASQYQPSPVASTSAIRLQNAVIGRSEDELLIQMANLTVPIGSLVVIHGPTGAGKSSILEAMMDNALILNPARGSVHVRGSVAFCSQNPWLQSLTIRDNILFGLPFDEQRYVNVLYACCLLRDLASMAHGDQTIIGPKGLTLSGGQKARIAMARACYADADVYLLDSPLASVDAIVQSDIFRRCIIDLLKHKTVVLVTHNEEIIASPCVDQAVSVVDHRLVVETRNRGQQQQSNRSRLTQPSAFRAKQQDVAAFEADAVRRPLCLVDTEAISIQQAWRRVQTKFKQSESPSSFSEPAAVTVWEATFTYVALCGGFLRFALPLVLLLGLSRASLVAAHLGIIAWSDAVTTTSPSLSSGLGLHSVEVFAVLLSLCSVASVLASIHTFRSTMTVAKTVLDRLVHAFLFSPMNLFYDLPIGTIMNRFSVDVRVLDESAHFSTLDVVFCFTGVVLPWLTLSFLIQEVALMGPVLLWLLARNRHRLRISVEIQRLLTASFAPCFDAIAEAIDGRHVIQAFGVHQVTRFRSEHHVNLDRMLQMTQAKTVLECWRVFQFFLVDTLLLVLIVCAVAIHHEAMTAAVFGLALNYASILSTNLFWLQDSMLCFGSDMVKVHQVVDYCKIPSERHTGQRVLHVPMNWPASGEIVFQDASFQYNSLSGPVLKQINLTIRPGEHIGLVGRTGAGKSSLTMALFRIHELVSGRILIDGVDIATVDLHTLRSRLSIIPQSPLFFKGTLRSYLDPFDDKDDAVLWSALRKTGLADVVARMEGKLQAELHENAENLSQGERQLLCLSRVLLKQSKVVVLDEATAAIDQDADESLQSVLRREFHGASVLSIAHRLESILQFDRVLVMDEGCIVQCGTVEELVSDATGPFFDLLEGALLKM